MLAAYGWFDTLKTKSAVRFRVHRHNRLNYRLASQLLMLHTLIG